MPLVNVAKWPPPARRTVLTRSGGSLVFAARDRLGNWFTVPGEHKMPSPESWLCDRILKGMEPVAPPKTVRLGRGKNQILLELDDSGTLARRVA